MTPSVRPGSTRRDDTSLTHPDPWRDATKAASLLRPRSTRFTDLSTLIRAHCWSEGYEAPLEWVHWLLDLELAAWAHRHGATPGQAETIMPLTHATEMGQMLVQIARDHA